LDVLSEKIGSVMAHLVLCAQVVAETGATQYRRRTRGPDEMSKKASQLRRAECSNCTALLPFRRAYVPKFDTQGFESYQLNCKYCGATLVGIVDPCDNTLLLSTQTSSKLSDGTTAAKLPC
jgi:hypothetical protein